VHLLDAKGKVDFAKVRQSRDFRDGVEKLRQCVKKGYILALMCAEANPLDCHRFSMVAYQLVREGFSVKHIMKTGVVQDNGELEAKLLIEYRHILNQGSLFERNSEVDQLDLAYRLKNEEIGFVVKNSLNVKTQV